MLGCPSSIEFHPVTRGECRFLFSLLVIIKKYFMQQLPFSCFYYHYYPSHSSFGRFLTKVVERREQNNKKRVTFWVALLMAGSFLDGIMDQWGNSAASRQLCLVVVVLPDFATTANNPSRGGSCCLPICGSHARYFRPERLQSPQWREISFAFPSR